MTHTLATTRTRRRPDPPRAVPTELTVAFTDLQGFTTYTQIHGDYAASRLLIDHHRDSAVIVAKHGGRVIKRLGDGLMLTFPRPQAAVLACLELAEEAPLSLRAGIHTGTVVITADDDVIGHVVNLAARLTTSAAGGQLIVTDHVRRAVGDLHHITFDGPYSRKLRGIEQRVEVYLTSRPIHRSTNPRPKPTTPP
jgi:adenylate cyclase